MPERIAADVVVATGRVLTLDGQDTVTEAIAVAGDRILAVGSANAMKDLADRRTRMIDMPGATVTPGINDAHAHMDREGLKRLRPSLAGCRSIAEIQDIVRSVAAQTTPGEWIVTMPLGEPPFFFDGADQLAERRPPNRDDLDVATSRHPVCIPGVFGNWGAPPGYTCLNSRALELNGIDRRTRPALRGIDVLIDAEGEPTGVIIEHNSRPMVEFDLLKAVPRFSSKDRCQGLLHSMQLYNSVGITSVYEGHGSAAEIIGIYRDLRESGALTLRVGLVLSPAWADADEAAAVMRDWLSYARGAGIGDRWLRISGIHVAYGGDPGMAQLARQDLPNSGWSGFVEQSNDAKEFEALCGLAARHGLRLNTIVADHLADVVEILERIHAAHGIGGRRWVVQHIGMTDRGTLERLARLDVLVTTIPVYFLWKGGHWYDAAVGDRVVPMRSMLDLGIRAAAATDNIPYNPGFTLWCMCERRRRSDGIVLGPGERLTRLQALRAMTVEGAALTFDEDVKGRLAPGFLADMAVFDIDPLAADGESLKTLSSRLTMVGGRMVHDPDG